jgi:putative oxidoreductase
MMQAGRQPLTTSIGLLILRLGAGGYLATHGWGKVQMLAAGAFDKFGDPIGLGNTASLVLTVVAEFVGALLVMVGLGTRFAAIPAVIAMAVAAFVVHANDPWTMGGGASKEPALLFLTAFLTLVFTGAGQFSFDALIGPRFRRKTEKADTSAKT